MKNNYPNRLCTMLMLSLLMVIGFVRPTPAQAQEASIVDIATSNDDFSTLTDALVHTDLVGALSSDGPFTVFAPNNAAFEKLLGTIGVEKITDLPVDAVAKILTYNVLGAEVFSTDLKTFQSAVTLNSEAIFVKKTAYGDVFVNSSRVIVADIEASNGVIHVIDKVLVPTEDQGNLATVLSSGLRNFSTLVAALEYTGLDAALAEGEFTVLAPTNFAFFKTLKVLVSSYFDDVGRERLTAILRYHVIEGKVLSGDLADSLSVSRLNGQEVSFTIGEGE